jgi:hypothetical protein
MTNEPTINGYPIAAIFLQVREGKSFITAQTLICTKCRKTEDVLLPPEQQWWVGWG